MHTFTEAWQAHRAKFLTLSFSSRSKFLQLIGARLLGLHNRLVAEGGELDGALTGVADGRRALDQRLAVLGNTHVHLVELPVALGVAVALDLRGEPQEVCERLGDLGDRVEPVVRHDAGVGEGGGDVVVVVEVEGGLEVLALGEAGAGAVLRPLVLPEVFVVR